jgi:hypothetical protein
MHRVTAERSEGMLYTLLPYSGVFDFQVVRHRLTQVLRLSFVRSTGLDGDSIFLLHPASRSMYSIGISQCSVVTRYCMLVVYNLRTSTVYNYLRSGGPTQTKKTQILPHQDERRV